MKNKLAILLIIVILSIAISSCGHSGDISYKIVENSGYFIVGYDPLSYHTFGGYGLAINIIKHAAERIGVVAPINPVNDYDWEANLINDDIDVMLCKSSNENLQTAPVFSDNIIFISIDPENINTVGIIDSEACIEQKNILSYQKSYDYIYYSDENLLLNDLEIGIVDGAILSEYEALQRSGITSYDIQVLSESPIYFIISSDKQTFYDALNNVLQQMALDGTTERLKREYIQGLQ